MASGNFPMTAALLALVPYDFAEAALKFADFAAPELFVDDLELGEVVNGVEVVDEGEDSAL